MTIEMFLFLPGGEYFYAYMFAFYFYNHNQRFVEKYPEFIWELELYFVQKQYMDNWIDRECFGFFKRYFGGIHSEDVTTSVESLFGILDGAFHEENALTFVLEDAFRFVRGRGYGDNEKVLANRRWRK